MSKIYFSKMEVLAYLEDKILMNMATEDELELYESFVWDGKLKRNNYTYKRLIAEMKKVYEGR